MRQLARRPEDVPSVFAERFNSGDPTAVSELYESGAVFVPEPGAPVTGERIESANAEFLGLGLPISVEPRHTYRADDIALLVVDWSIDGTGEDSQPVHIEGTATDVVRRGPDGYWRYVVDNPFGVRR